MHGKQVHFSILIFMTQSCTKGGKYMATAPREGPAAPKAENVKSQGGLCNGPLVSSQEEPSTCVQINMCLYSLE